MIVATLGPQLMAKDTTHLRGSGVGMDGWAIAAAQ